MVLMIRLLKEKWISQLTIWLANVCSYLINLTDQSLIRCQ